MESSNQQPQPSDEYKVSTLSKFVYYIDHDVVCFREIKNATEVSKHEPFKSLPWVFVDNTTTVMRLMDGKICDTTGKNNPENTEKFVKIFDIFTRYSDSVNYIVFFTSVGSNPNVDIIVRREYKKYVSILANYSLPALFSGTVLPKCSFAENNFFPVYISPSSLPGIRSDVFFALEPRTTIFEPNVWLRPVKSPLQQHLLTCIQSYIDALSSQLYSKQNGAIAAAAIGSIGLLTLHQYTKLPKSEKQDFRKIVKHISNTFTKDDEKQATNDDEETNKKEEEDDEEEDDEEEDDDEEREQEDEEVNMKKPSLLRKQKQPNRRAAKKTEATKQNPKTSPTSIQRAKQFSFA